MTVVYATSPPVRWTVMASNMVKACECFIPSQGKYGTIMRWISWLNKMTCREVLTKECVYENNFRGSNSSSFLRNKHVITLTC
jgi:hypothetical protein